MAITKLKFQHNFYVFYLATNVQINVQITIKWHRIIWNVTNNSASSSTARKLNRAQYIKVTLSNNWIGQPLIDMLPGVEMVVVSKANKGRQGKNNSRKSNLSTIWMLIKAPFTKELYVWWEYKPCFNLLRKRDHQPFIKTFSLKLAISLNKCMFQMLIAYLNPPHIIFYISMVEVHKKLIIFTWAPTSYHFITTQSPLLEVFFIYDSNKQRKHKNRNVLLLVNYWGK